MDNLKKGTDGSFDTFRKWFAGLMNLKHQAKNGNGR